MQQVSHYTLDGTIYAQVGHISEIAYDHVKQQSQQSIVLGITGPSGSGKTTLIERLIPALQSFKLKISTVKNVHHELELDKPGKDSFRHREAGAKEVMVSLPSGWALFHHKPDDQRLPIEMLKKNMEAVDLILVEGFRSPSMKQIEVFNSSLSEPLNQPNDSSVIAVVADIQLPELTVPTFQRDNIDGITALIITYLNSVLAG